MRKRICFAFVFLAFAASCVAQTVVEVQEVKELKPTGSLGTCSYGPAKNESAFLHKLAPAEKVTGSFMDKHEYKIQGKSTQFVSWFGVLRGATEDESKHTYNLLIEQKYFDGMTDCHIMLVSNAGAGDFVATAKLDECDDSCSVAGAGLWNRARRKGWASLLIGGVHSRVAMVHIHLH